MRAIAIKRPKPVKGKRGFFRNPISSFVRNVTLVASRMKSWGELHSFFDTIAKGSADKGTVAAQLAEYRSWVNVAVSVIYRRVEAVEHRYYRNDTHEEIKPQETAYDSINKIFLKPNPFMSYRFLKAYWQLQLDLTGMAFGLRLDDGFGIPEEIYPLNVDNFVEVVKGETFKDWILGFTFDIGGEYITYRPENILYFHYPHPKDPRIGSSPVQNQAYAIDVDHYLEVYERDFFKNSARPDFLLTFPEGVEIGGEEEANRIKAQWRKSFGNENFHSMGILDQGGDVKELTPKNKDLDLMFLADWSADKILAAYNVPPGKVGLVKDVNRANAVGIDITFNCYSEDTEFLTQVGWKNIHQYEQGDKIATVNPDSADIEFHVPSRKFQNEYNGNMVHFKTKQIDMLVTPNHRMWYSRQTGKTTNGKWKTLYTPWGFEEAGKLAFEGNGIGAKRIYMVNHPVYFDNENELERIVINEVSNPILAKQITNEPYSGTVWCFTVPNHLFITRRNGKIAVQGNSECIKPRLDLHDDVMNRKVLSLFDPPNHRIYMKHNNPIPRDRELDIKEIEKKVAVPMWTINEARARDGQGPVVGGDVIYVPLNYLPLGTVPPEPKAPGEEGETRMIEKGDDWDYPESWKVARWLKFKAFTLAWERIWVSRLKELFTNQMDEVLNNLDAYGNKAVWPYTMRDELLKNVEEKWKVLYDKYNGWSGRKLAATLKDNPKEVEDLICNVVDDGLIALMVEGLMKGAEADSMVMGLEELISRKQAGIIEALLFDWDSNMKVFSKEGRRIISSVMAEAGQEELVMLGLDMEFSLENPLARQFLGDLVEEFSTEVLSTKADQLRRTLGVGFASGESIQQLATRVTGVYADVIRGGYDAVRIARTETIRASNAGSYLAYGQSGIVGDKGWLSVRDKRTRGNTKEDKSDHWRMDGQRVPNDKPFIDPRSGSRLMFPGDTSRGAGGHDVILCRCTIVPFVKGR